MAVLSGTPNRYVEGLHPWAPNLLYSVLLALARVSMGIQQQAPIFRYHNGIGQSEVS